MQFKKSTDTPLAYHFVVRAQYPHAPFTNRAYATKSWQRLTSLFPNTVATVFMPNHLHLIAWGKNLDANQKQNMLRQYFYQQHWEPAPGAIAIPDVKHLNRQVRYVHLNPCRAKLCIDPLLWAWSTHRDYMNASVRSWPETNHCLNILGFPTDQKGRDDFHKYVSSDPSVHPLGSAPPLYNNQFPVLLDLRLVERAAELAYRTESGSFRRKGKLRAELLRTLCFGLGVPVTKAATHFGVHWTAIRPSKKEFADITKKRTAALLTTLAEHRLLNPVDIPSMSRT